jgi:rod shape-determining protein MreD
MIRLIPYILYLLLLVMHRVIFKDLTSIAGVSISLSVLLVVLVAIYKTEIVALWFGFFVGLVLGAGIPEQVGWYALTLTLIGTISYQMRERLNLDSLKARLLMVAGACLLFNLCSLLILRTDAFWYRSATVALSDTLYTMILAWLFFLFKEGKITKENIKSIF